MTPNRQDAADTRVKYSAAWSPDECEVTVVRDVYAGVSGPHGDHPAASTAEADAVLFAAGYLRTDDWALTGSGSYWCRLSIMR